MCANVMCLSSIYIPEVENLGESRQEALQGEGEKKGRTEKVPWRKATTLETNDHA